MKRISLIVCAILLCVSVFSGCKKIDNTDPSDDSYQLLAEKYPEDMPGVKRDGFVNTTKVKISSEEDALERAKNECTIKWKSAETSFDSVSKIWTVVFFEGMNVAGGCQSVYMDENGKTVLIVYGE